MTVKGEHYLVIIDYFPKFIEAESLQKLDIKTTVDRLKSIFARHGTPKIIRSDIGTNFIVQRNSNSLKISGT